MGAIILILGIAVVGAVVLNLLLPHREEDLHEWD